MNKVLQRLEEGNLLSRDWFLHNRRNKHFIQLTELGFEIVSELLDVQPDSRGTGYGMDLGDFPYELHRPVARVTSQNIYHHLFMVDVMFVLRQSGVSRRDNRYCSVSYEYEGQDWKFRPDGEVIINNDVYFF